MRTLSICFAFSLSTHLFYSLFVFLSLSLSLIFDFSIFGLTFGHLKILIFSLLLSHVLFDSSVRFSSLSIQVVSSFFISVVCQIPRAQTSINISVALKNGPFTASFSLFSTFQQLTVNKESIKFADGRI